MCGPEHLGNHPSPVITSKALQGQGFLICNACWEEVTQPNTWRPPSNTYSWEPYARATLFTEKNRRIAAEVEREGSWCAATQGGH